MKTGTSMHPMQGKHAIETRLGHPVDPMVRTVCIFYAHALPRVGDILDMIGWDPLTTDWMGAPPVPLTGLWTVTFVKWDGPDKPVIYIAPARLPI